MNRSMRSMLALWLAWQLVPTWQGSGQAAESARARQLDEQREDAAVRQAQQAVNEAQQDVRQAQQSWQKAQSAFRSAEANRKAAAVAVQKTIDRLEDEHAETAGLTAARERLKAARAAFSEAAEPILATVRKGPDYASAEKDLAAATAALDPDVEGDREEAVRNAAAARARMRELERAATDPDPQLKSLSARVSDAEAKLDAAHDRFEKAVDNDSELKAARTALAAAKTAESRAEASLVKENRDLLSARAKLGKAQQTLQAKQLADQRDSNKPPKPKTKQKAR